MAIGDVNPTLKARTLYYDLTTGETRIGCGNGRAWHEEPKACVEPAPTFGGPYARRSEKWVDMGAFVSLGS